MSKHVYTDRIRDAIRDHGNLPCLHIKRNGEYQSWTYDEFGKDLNRVVSALGKAGLRPNDNAVVIGENTPEWIIAYHAIILCGARTVPIDPNLPANEIHDIIRVTKTKVVFCSKTYLPVIREIMSESQSLQQIIVLEETHNRKELTFRAFADTGTADTNAFEREFHPDDPMVILFTSGTTGKSKGAVLVQKNYTAAGLYGVPLMEIGPGDSILAILPLHHVFGFAACIAAPLTTGLDVVFVPRIKGPLILEALNDRHVSVLPAVPKMLTVLYDNIQRKVKARGAVVIALFAVLRFLSHTLGPVLGMGFRKKLFKTVHDGFGGNLGLVISGGASLAPQYFKGFRLMGFNIMEGYGLTETFGPITICPAKGPRIGSVGPALPENEVTIDTPDKDGIGEVLLRGTTVFKEYYENEEATKAVFDKDGWFHSGDLGRLSKNGYLYLVGRSKDVIVLESGKNVFPDELEDYYSESTIIDEIGVFGAMVKGKVIAAAIVVPSADIRKKYDVNKATEIVQNEMIRMGQNRPSYKRVTDFALSYQALPRTSTRKLRKHELKEMYAKLKADPKATRAAKIRLSAAEETLMNTADFRKIAKCVSEIAPRINKDRITPRAHLELDLELDSLRQLDLFCAVEEAFSIVVPEESFTSIETLGDLYARVLETENKPHESLEENHNTIRKRIASSDATKLTIEDNRSVWYSGAGSFSGMFSKVVWDVKTSGAETLPDDKPLVLVSNHESLLDIPWILSALPWPVRKRTFTIGKIELLRVPVFSGLFKRSNMIPVERQGDVVEALKASIAVLKRGKNLLIFPEGTRTRDGRMGPFKSGIGLLLLETNAAVVPIRVRGGFALWPKGGIPRFFSGRKLHPTVTFGTPFSLQDLIDQGKVTPYDSGEAIATQIRSIVESM